MTEIMEEIDEDIKTSVINMLKNLKQDMYEMKWEIDDIKNIKEILCSRKYSIPN